MIAFFAVAICSGALIELASALVGIGVAVVIIGSLILSLPARRRASDNTLREHQGDILHVRPR